MKPIYQPTEYGKFEAKEALEVISDLEPMGESREYIDGLAAQFLKLMREQRGAKEFGMESAKEVVTMMIVKGFFRPMKG